MSVAVRDRRWMPNVAALGGVNVWNQVELLMHMDGINGGASFIDEKGHTIITAFGIETRTSTRKFGTASLYNGAGNSLSISGGITPFGTGDYTVECWVNTAGTSPNPEHDMTLFSTYAGVANQGAYFALQFVDPDYFVAYISPAGLTVAGTTPVTLSVWHHVAWCRKGTTLRLFLDGTLQATSSSYTPTLSSTTAEIAGSAGGSLLGYMDDLRVIRGWGLYTAAFTPPVAAFPNG